MVSGGIIKYFICLLLNKYESWDVWDSSSRSFVERREMISSRPCLQHPAVPPPPDLNHADCSTSRRHSSDHCSSSTSNKSWEVGGNTSEARPRPSRSVEEHHRPPSELFQSLQSEATATRSILASLMSKWLKISFELNEVQIKLTDNTVSTSSKSRFTFFVFLPVSGSLWTYCFFGLQHGRLKILSFSTEYDDSILRWSQFSLAQQHPMTMTVQIYLLITTGGYYNIVTGIDQCQGD